MHAARHTTTVARNVLLSASLGRISRGTRQLVTGAKARHYSGIGSRPWIEARSACTPKTAASPHRRGYGEPSQPLHAKAHFRREGWYPFSIVDGRARRYPKRWHGGVFSAPFLPRDQCPARRVHISGWSSSRGGYAMPLDRSATVEESTPLIRALLFDFPFFFLFNPAFRRQPPKSKAENQLHHHVAEPFNHLVSERTHLPRHRTHAIRLRRGHR